MASYPEGWQDWPVVKESQNLPADTVLPPETSLFIQESVRSYSWINNGQGSPLKIRVNPQKIEQYKTHGPYTDGPTAVAISEVDGIVWVTEHIGGMAKTHLSSQVTFLSGSIAGRNYANLMMPSTKESF